MPIFLVEGPTHTSMVISLRSIILSSTSADAVFATIIAIITLSR
jgi:hypothetical protein